jgi:hypothetical protein
MMACKTCMAAVGGWTAGDMSGGMVVNISSKLLVSSSPAAKKRKGKGKERKGKKKKK